MFRVLVAFSLCK